MKVIDLLNKIANGEEVPKKIKYCMTNFKYDTYANEYLSIEDETNNGNISIFKYIFTPNLNDEVEIIEEDKKIEKIETYDIAGNIFIEDHVFKYIPIDKHKLTANEQVFVDKINEIIDKINSMEVK